MNTPFRNVDEYINNCSEDIQVRSKEIRATIKQHAPDTEESIRYGMPAYNLYGRPLVYFAAFKHHIGFYATPSGHSEFSEELSAYKQGKGSVQFPYDRPFPLQLIAKIVKFRVKENRSKYGKL